MLKKKIKLLIFLLILFLSVGAILVYTQVWEKDDRVCHRTGLPYQNPALSTELRVADLMNRMTISEEIGQMILIEKNSIHNIGDITRYNLGALLSGGGAKPKQNTPLAWLQM